MASRPAVGVFFVGMLVSSNFGFKFEEISTVVMMGSLRPMYAHALEGSSPATF